MVIGLIRNWWAVGIVGALSILLGLAAFFWPITTLASLVMAFGAFALVTGIIEVVAGISGEGAVARASRGWLILWGAISIIAGLVTMFWPGVTAVALYTLVAIWAIAGGIAQTVAAIVHREHLEHTWLVALGGVAMAAFGFYLLAQPAGGVLALAVAIGTFAIAYGVAMLASAAMLKRVHDRVEVTLTHEGRTVAHDEDRVIR